MTRHFEAAMGAKDATPTINFLGEEVYINEFLYFENCPRTFRQLVCYPANCLGDMTVDGYSKRSSDVLYKHNSCRRPHFSSLFRCIGCDAVFIRDFYDSRFCFCSPRCWDCLSGLPPTFGCTIHAKSKHSSCSPEGLNPKVNTIADLNAFMEELGLDITL